MFEIGIGGPTRVGQGIPEAGKLEGSGRLSRQDGILGSLFALWLWGFVFCSSV